MEEGAGDGPSSPTRSHNQGAPIEPGDAIQMLLRRAGHEAAATLRRRFAEERRYLNPGLSDRTLRIEFIDPLLDEISELLMSLGDGPPASEGSWC
jgi:hypothetical protein